MSETYQSKGKQKDMRKAKRKSRHDKTSKHKQNDEEVGFSKIKSSLRQTRRLLAKETLAASVRQEAERKLVALEDELRMKESKEKERKNAQRYHQIRFFERQKLVRRINQLKKAQNEDDATVKADLYEARLLLNYVLHYPMSQKYIALFPKEEDLSQRLHETAEEKNASKEGSENVKERIKKAMEKGDLSKEPEIDLEIRTTDDATKESLTKRKLESIDTISQKKTKKMNDKESAQSNTLEDDDFFA